MGQIILKTIIVILVVVSAGYMAYDGYHALTTGDYIRPTEGEYAGQLGPWTMFASMAGIDPLSAMMKYLFLGSGIFGLAAVFIFLMLPKLGSTLLMLFCFLTLWNIMFGALSSFITIILLLSWRRLYKTKQASEAPRHTSVK